MPTHNEFTKILSWPGYRVYRHAIAEQAKTLPLWIRRKRGNPDSGEPLWFRQDRKKETLDEFFQAGLSPKQRGAIEAICVYRWKPYRLSIRGMGTAR